MDPSIQTPRYSGKTHGIIVDCLNIFDDMVGALDFEEKAGQRVITHLAQNLLSVSSLSLRFTCKMRDFRSGAEGNRTPDLRRAKAAQYFAGSF